MTSSSSSARQRPRGQASAAQGQRPPAVAPTQGKQTLPPTKSHTKSGVPGYLGLFLLLLVGIFIIIPFSGVSSLLSRRVASVLFGVRSLANNPKMATNPFSAQAYQLLEKTKLSPDSYLLKYAIEGRSILGVNPEIPTCIKVDYPDGTDAKTNQPKILSKSYSPVSHPNTQGTFDLIVKSYPLQAGGGVGKFICDMDVGHSITATLKKERVMHGSTEVEGRWKQVGLVAGGTGIAPLLQLARILLDSPKDQDTTISLLFLNRHEYDILGKSWIDQMVADHPQHFQVTYALTGEEDATVAASYETGRGTVEMARKALPPPSDSTMIFVCGKDGFVAHWGGPVGRGPPKADGKKGPKIQGPLLGVLKEAGYTAEQVFKY